MAGGRIYRLAWALYLVLALGGALWIGLRRGVIPLRLFFDPARWWIDLGAGVVAGAALLLVWLLAERTLPLARRLEEQLAALLGELAPSEALALALLSGFAEELFFRGAVQGAWGWLWATLVFALLHTGPGPAFRLWAVFALLAGGIFGGLVVWSGNLLAPVVAHFLVNAVNLGRLARRRAAAPGEPPPLC